MTSWKPSAGPGVGFTMRKPCGCKAKLVWTDGKGRRRWECYTCESCRPKLANEKAASSA